MNAPRAGTPPWHLWGTSELVSPPPIVPPFPGTVASQAFSKQLARVDYGRPDSFKWFFSAQIVRADDAVLAGETGQISIFWEVTIGSGRSSVVIPLDNYVLQWGPIASFPTAMIFSQTAEGPLRTPGSTETNVIDTLVADGLQCQARVIYITNITGAQPAQVQLSAHFAPIAHVRPDWYQVDADPTVQFPGGEIGGR